MRGMGFDLHEKASRRGATPGSHPASMNVSRWARWRPFFILGATGLLVSMVRSAEPVGAPSASPRGGEAPPNIVMIISDDHHWGDYGFMGHAQVKTPNLDRLSKESLTFRRGYVPCSLCCPSLASVITGRYPHQHRVTSNDPAVPPGMTEQGYKASPAFDAGRELMSQHLEEWPTLPRLLVKQGYLAMQTGKWGKRVTNAAASLME
jgi:Sulfatase